MILQPQSPILPDSIQSLARDHLYGSFWVNCPLPDKSKVAKRMRLHGLRSLFLANVVGQFPRTRHGQLEHQKHVSCLTAIHHTRARVGHHESEAPVGHLSGDYQEGRGYEGLKAHNGSHLEIQT